MFPLFIVHSNLLDPGPRDRGRGCRSPRMTRIPLKEILRCTPPFWSSLTPEEKESFHELCWIEEVVIGSMEPETQNAYYARSLYLRVETLKWIQERRDMVSVKRKKTRDRTDEEQKAMRKAELERLWRVSQG